MRAPGGMKHSMTDTTGRFCMLGGCGEQLDLWDEGQFSTLAVHGAGVSNYFKYIKFCGWTFFVLTCINIPHLVINASGEGIIPATSADNIALTTLGNLGNEQDSVVLPYCSADEFGSICYLDIDTVAVLYGWLDALQVLIVFAGYLWVTSYIKDEFDQIKRNAITASDYTVQLPWVPPGISELEIKAHFSKVTGRAVAEVVLSKDFRTSIQLYK
ncbi:unnamed protein product, partial [Chrysoparadoxa australica]